MPYTLSTRKKGGKKKYCMTSKETGKTYCYSSAKKRAKGMKMHEAFKHGWKPTGKAKPKTAKKAIKKKVAKAMAPILRKKKSRWA